MIKSQRIFCLLISILLTGASFCLAETQIPFEPLVGMAGLDKVIEIQRETGKPIILWSTWDTCPNTKRVAKWFSSPQVSNLLKEYPRVILESKGNEDEARESRIRGFSGGNFYIIKDYYFESMPYASVWAWEKGTYTLKRNLLKQISKAL